jgi:hypothetical protein
MRRAEAEREADRRNREDPGSARFEFYAYDESAGLADEAWEVGARLRRDPSTAPATYAAAAGIARAPEPYSEPPPQAWPMEAPPPPAPSPPRAPRGGRAAADSVGRWVQRRREGRAAPEAEPRPGLFVRSVAGVVIVIGMLWMGVVVALAVLLKPDDLTGVGLYLGAAVLGLMAIALGAAIRRS